ncbi:hypothetical protein QBC35DRAFT_168661 [Podospora australis]|uniref:HNH nuclease domain-containing protein n=1 Tax=Podospora australis TaxID=1536484 RepID=A0AAN6WLT7_9PEZI|nr:hypothetical protein QBC35DRAFT_168661 [Podospora australis]
MDANAKIVVTSIGNHAYDWQHSELASQMSQGSSLLSQHSDSEFLSQESGGFPSSQELKREFINWVSQRIQLLINSRGYAGSTTKINEVKGLHGLLTIIHDPASSISIKDRTKFQALMAANGWTDLARAYAFREHCDIELLRVQRIFDFWTPDTTRGTEDAITDNDNDPRPIKNLKRKCESEISTPTKTAGRCSGDLNAQSSIKNMYHGCLLTGAGKDLSLHGAHILEVHVVKRLAPNTDEEALFYWNLLKHFWPLDALTSLNLQGNKKRNVIPLRIEAHKYWDDSRILLRPIKHLSNPDNILYIQVLYVQDINKEGNLANTPYDYSKGTLHDHRRPMIIGSRMGHEHIRHCDVYQLETPDPETLPLPEFRFF